MLSSCCCIAFVCVCASVGGGLGGRRDSYFFAYRQVKNRLRRNTVLSCVWANRNQATLTSQAHGGARKPERPSHAAETARLAQLRGSWKDSGELVPVRGKHRMYYVLHEHLPASHY